MTKYVKQGSLVNSQCLRCFFNIYDKIICFKINISLRNNRIQDEYIYQWFRRL